MEKEQTPDFVNVLQFPNKAEYLLKIILNGEEIPFAQLNDTSIGIFSVGKPMSPDDVGALDYRFFLKFASFRYDDFMRLETDPDHVPTPVVVMESYIGEDDE